MDANEIAIAVPEEHKPLGIKEATEIATRFVQDAYQNIDMYNVMLEEIDKSPSGDYWFITIGFSSPLVEPVRSLTSAFIGSPRTYKIVKINRKTGEVESMKMRVPERAER